MKFTFWQVFLALTVIAASLFAPSVAMASLGGDVSSIQDDQAHMRAALQIQTGEQYTVHDLHDSSGAVVREFISPEGKVFAITWKGQFIPDLHQILGSYFDQFSQAVQSRPRRPGRAPLNVQAPGLVVQSGGHMRSYSGRAYLPDKLPEGITPAQIH